MAEGWQHVESPFHAGEQEVQERLGVRGKIESLARRVVRDYLPEQHRAFFDQLPFLLTGTVDDLGRPWASLLAGRPGFVSSPDPRRLKVAGRPLFGDPLNETLKPGAEIGVLGIELETRRRNRLAGRVESVESGGFVIAVEQTFGNCPQYIQTRSMAPLPEVDDPRRECPVTHSDRFDGPVRALIGRADTLFIATAYSENGASPSQGADVSHRGGKPGFVKVEGDRGFVFPDFSGNYHFNTIGNLLLNPKAGFVFVDFESRDLVYMTGVTEIVWEGEEVRAFAGAERLIRFEAEAVVRVAGGLPFRFDFGDYSPMLAHTGSWSEAREKIAADRERNVYVPYEVFEVEKESETISSFYLRRLDGRALADYEPGQFLPIRLTIPGKEEPQARTYTLSDSPSSGHYRLSIKREGGQAIVSNYLHGLAGPGLHLEAMAPRGKFVLDESSERPVVLISAGVGITPMIAITNHIIDEGRRTRNFRRIFFVHGARSDRERAFASHIERLAAEYDNLTAHIRLSRPDDGDRLGETHDSVGHVDIDLLKALLPFDDYDFYLCGPAPFMREIYQGLSELGVRGGRIHYESFGPATVLKTGSGLQRSTSREGPGAGPVLVRFESSDVELEWSPEKGTLLELAEAAGLSPEFSCRSGICGTCATRIKCGAVDYLEEPSAFHEDGQVLICCSTPRSAGTDASCGEYRGVVLEL